MFATLMLALFMTLKAFAFCAPTSCSPPQCGSCQYKACVGDQTISPTIDQINFNLASLFPGNACSSDAPNPSTITQIDTVVRDGGFTPVAISEIPKQYTFHFRVCVDQTAYGYCPPPPPPPPP